jgi:hypothetical protein
MKIKRYAIQLDNGDYMLGEFSRGVDRVDVRDVGSVIDSSLLKTKNLALEYLDEILNEKTNLPVYYNKSNPPVRVVEVVINYEITS